MLRAEIGIENPFGAAARDRCGLARIAGERHQPCDRDVAAGLGEPGGGELLGIEPPLAADLGARSISRE